MLKFVLFSLIIFVLNMASQASELKTYCDEDPSGELYSELWDASFIEDAFISIGLNPKEYGDLIATYDGESIFSLAREYRESYPEIWTAVRMWKLETCITKGYEEISR